MFCINNDKDKFSNHVKIVDIRISGGDGIEIWKKSCLEEFLDQDENDLLKDEDVCTKIRCFI